MIIVKVNIVPVFDDLKNVPTASGLPSRETGEADASTAFGATKCACKFLFNYSNGSNSHASPVFPTFVGTGSMTMKAILRFVMLSLAVMLSLSKHDILNFPFHAVMLR